MSNWIQIGPSVLAAFLGSLVEFVEALTIVLAVGTVRGWRPLAGGSVRNANLRGGFAGSRMINTLTS